MNRIFTREELILEVEKLRKARRRQNFFRNLLKGTTKTAGKEVWLETASGKVKTLWYGFEKRDPAPLYLDMHGGGFVLGSAAQDEAMNLAIAQNAGVKVVSIEYYKAPEYPYPVALDQVLEIVGHLRNQALDYGVFADRMAIGGHSAGGNLAAAACLRSKAEGRPQFLCQILDYPPMDLATSPYDKPQIEGGVPLHRAAIFDASYVKPENARDKYVSPVYASPEDLKSLPPALVILPGKDSLHDEGLRYADMLKAAGVSVEVREYPNSGHGFTKWPSVDTSDAVEKMAAFIHKHVF